MKMVFEDINKHKPVVGMKQKQSRLNNGKLGRGISIVIFALLFLVGCTSGEDSLDQTDRSGRETPESIIHTPTPEPTPVVKRYTQEAKLIAVGDVMMHSPQTKSGYDPKSDTYSFDSFFSEVKELLSSGDWVIANLETPLAGPETGYTGYPMFNAPAELADALKSAGFNIISTTNNHSLDRKEKGLIKTLEHLWERDLLTVGTYASQEEADKLLIVEKNEISMAILAYTYGTNGIPIPQGKDYLVSLIDETKMVEEIRKAREAGVDLVTVVLHFGIEYQRKPNEEQKRLVNLLVKEGADIILGSHPHVVQPFDFVQVTDDQGVPRRGVVIYSMGNFISNQRGDYKDIGVIFEVNIKKQFPEGTIEVTEVKAYPTWVHRYREQNNWKYRVLNLQEILTNKNDSLLTENDYTVLEKYLTTMTSHLYSIIETGSQQPK